MNLEKLIEQRTAVIEKLEALKAVAMTETRAFTDDEIAKVDGYKKEVARLDATIKELEETRSFEPKAKPQAPAEKTIADEIRALDGTKEIEVGMIEVRGNMANVHSMTTVQGSQAIGNVAKKTFADTILDKLAYISPLYGAIRKERFTSANHQIPVQANKLGKFVPMTELADYAKQSATFAPINLEPHKFGTMISFSEEVLEDEGYNVEGELITQLTDAYGTTLDELIIKGEGDVQGLESFGVKHDTLAPADGSKGVAIAQAGIEIDNIIDMYYALPIRYRQTATWVMSDKMALALSKMKDANGMPLLVQNYNVAPFGATHTVLGRPVIISEYVSSTGEENSKEIYFGDLKRALIIGERRSLKLTKSTEYGFVRDEIAIKASIRLDVKRGLGEAMVVGVVANA